MMHVQKYSRRHAMALFAAAAAMPATQARAAFREITWDDLIPPGVPYSEIVGPGFMDEANDIWLPEYDANATRFNEALDGARVRLPGYVVPLDTAGEGTSEFLLVPYVGACIHTPPPPPNQLVLVTSQRPWSVDELWAPVWVNGRLDIAQLTTEIAEVGYRMSAEDIEVYEW